MDKRDNIPLGYQNKRGMSTLYFTLLACISLPDKPGSDITNFMKSDVLILGAGSWGTALAQTLATSGRVVYLWNRSADMAAQMEKSRINHKYFPQFTLEKSIQVVDQWEPCLAACSLIVLAVPTSTLPHYLSQLHSLLEPHHCVINASKGLDHQTRQTISMMLQQSWGAQQTRSQYGVLSGPSFALEVMQKKPTAIALAMENQPARQEAAKLLHNGRFRIFQTSDVLGVELSGALKNVIAITVGASDALDFGLNTRAALLTKGQEEISKIGAALGAQNETFWGLAGIGDLILTCTGDLSRNRRVGQYLAQGKSVRATLKALGQIAEGIRTTKSAHKIGKTLGVDTPILRETYRALFKGKPIQEAVETILQEMK
jgi:glycerol-3-phosphate dehydrogenase (NAD(P)+)